MADNEVLQNEKYIKPSEYIQGDAGLELQVMLDNMALTNRLLESNKALQEVNQALVESMEAQRRSQVELRRLEQERQKRELAEAKAGLYRAISEAMPHIVWTASANGEVDYLNRQWYQFTETYPENCLGFGWLNEIHPDDRPGFEIELREAIAKAKPFEGEARLRGANGDYRWFLFRSLPIKDEANVVIKQFGTGTDIDKQKELEFELAQSQEQAVDSFDFVRGA
jgi:PAS domain S-box-containing protein